ncbi:hypothetical protein VNI00_018619 [Paramarasmius palmivorus]|uniref:Ribonuclease H1 N-terminal domain-containing protein n=1 Tax=Paramarasmius palmivorus TaxID=297713 RepID=A0AAW0AVI9_9AGAR
MRLSQSKVSEVSAPTASDAISQFQNIVNDLYEAIGQARDQQAELRESFLVTEELIRGMLDQLSDQINGHHAKVNQCLQTAENTGSALRHQLDVIRELLNSQDSTGGTRSRSSSFSSMETDVDNLIRAVQLAPDGTPIPQLTPVNSTPRLSQSDSQPPANFLSTAPATVPTATPASPMRSRNRRAGGHMVLSGRAGGHGVFDNWADANDLVLGVSNPMYRAFDHYTQAKAAYDACVNCGLVGTLVLPWNPSTEWFVLFIGVSPGIHQRSSLMHAIGLANFEKLTRENIRLASSKEQAEAVWRSHGCYN